MSVSPDSKLNQHPTFNYESFISSPGLADTSSRRDSNSNFTKKPDIELKQIASGSPDVSNQSLPNCQETEESCFSLERPLPVCVVSVCVALAVTIAMVLELFLGGSVAFKGVLLSDHEHCSKVGQMVLADGGSSVDAAIAAALCLGVVHPHASGLGGGGMMLVHDMHRNETKVLQFQGAIPKALRWENVQNMSVLKAGLQVGVPGMLMGLQHAHSLYGSLSWEDVVSRAAAVAREGFIVSNSLAVAISQVRDEQLSQRFRDVFFPQGRALSPGSSIRMPTLAAVLQARLSNFYHGNISQEIQHEVEVNGGLLGTDDMRNYSIEVEQPKKGQFDDFLINVPSSSLAGAALISSLKLWKQFNLSGNNVTANQSYHWIFEALKAGGLADIQSNSSVAALLSRVLRKNQAEKWMSESHSAPSEYSSSPKETEQLGGQVVVMGPDNLMVSVASSLSNTFGSRIMTRSGIILNSLVLDLIWTNKVHEPDAELQEKPELYLMPIIIVPVRHRCGIYMAASSSGGRNHLKTLTRMLKDSLFIHNKKNHRLQPNQTEIPEARLVTNNQHLQRMTTNPVVLGIKRSENVISIIEAPLVV